jgi:hypothetical protein
VSGSSELLVKLSDDVETSGFDETDLADAVCEVLEEATWGYALSSNDSRAEEETAEIDTERSRKFECRGRVLGTNSGRIGYRCT